MTPCPQSDSAGELPRRPGCPDRVGGELLTCFSAIGFGLDLVDHSLGWNGPVVPIHVTMPIGCVVTMYLTGDGKVQLKRKRKR
jgi:hypothetical protein